jgi:hypothetical protein
MGGILLAPALRSPEIRRLCLYRPTVLARLGVACNGVASPFLLVISEGSFTAGVSMYGGNGPASLGLCRRWRGKWAGPSWHCAQGGRGPLADEIWPLRSSTEDRYENALIDLLKKKEAGVTAGWHDHCGQNSFIKRWRGCHATRFLEEARCYKSNMRFLARS